MGSNIRRIEHVFMRLGARTLLGAPGLTTRNKNTTRSKKLCVWSEAYIESQSVPRKGPMMVVEEPWGFDHRIFSEETRKNESFLYFSAFVSLL